MATLAEMVGRYVDLLIAQYRDKPKARQTVAIYGKQFMADGIALQLSAVYDVDSAVGPQLDVIGKYVGVNRNIGGSTPPPLFSFWYYGAPMVQANYQSTWDPLTNTPAAVATSGFWYVARKKGQSTAPNVQNWEIGDILWYTGTAWLKINSISGNGLTTYADPSVNPDAVFYSYGQASRQFSALPDAAFRTIIKLKIILNHNDGTLASILDYLEAFFPSQIFVQDHADMTMTYLVLSTVPVSSALLSLYLPKPMGVGINVIIINPTPGGTGRITTEGGDILTTEDGDPLVTET